MLRHDISQNVGYTLALYAIQCKMIIRIITWQVVGLLLFSLIRLRHTLIVIFWSSAVSVKPVQSYAYVRENVLAEKEGFVKISPHFAMLNSDIDIESKSSWKNKPFLGGWTYGGFKMEIEEAWKENLAISGELDSRGWK